MKIADIQLGRRPVLLAPMEDVTDPAFRMICKEQGAAMVYTEFVSAEALVRDIPSTLKKLRINDAERPVAIQIYGREPADMVRAAQIVEKAGPDIIDLNFGCPVKRVASKGAGAGMLRDIPKMLDITRSVVQAVDLPVTVKTRLGWDHDNKIICDLGPMLQDCGIKAITVHGRTRSQMYTGDADWTLIGKLKADPRMEIPVIGNGDITTPERAEEGFEKFGVDAVMIGRASFGAPWIFSDVRRYLDRHENQPDTGQELTAAEKFAMLKRMITENIENIDEYRGILHTRRHLAATPLLKRLPNFRPMRIRMLRAETKNELMDILDQTQELYFSPESQEDL